MLGESLTATIYSIAPLCLPLIPFYVFEVLPDCLDYQLCTIDISQITWCSIFAFLFAIFCDEVIKSGQ